MVGILRACVYRDCVLYSVFTFKFPGKDVESRKEVDFRCIMDIDLEFDSFSYHFDHEG